MPNKCWCGNEELKRYSDEYSCCERCHTLVSNYEFNPTMYEVKDEQDSLYGENYWKQYFLSMTGFSNLDEIIDFYLRERAMFWLENFLKYSIPPGKCIEVGCGLGQFSYLLNRIGFQETALELSPEICKFIKSRLNINVVCGQLDNLDGCADNIIAHDVVEHILDIHSFMNQIRSRMTSQGLLFIQTPCYNEQLPYDEIVKNNATFLNLLRPEQHIYLFSKNSMKQLLKSYGYNYIVFEHAFFGDDYDMYVIASNYEIKENTQEEIDRCFYSHDNGRMIKSMLSLFELMRNTQSERDVYKIASEQRLVDVLTLTTMLQDAQVTAEDRLHDIEELTKQLEETKKAAEDRLQDVFKLTSIINSGQGEV